MPQVISPVANSVFLWQVEGLSVSVAFSGGILGAIRDALDRAPEDTEFGGILVGAVARDGDGFRTQVDAFEPFPIEHRHGANYTLSPRDQRFLEQRLNRLRRRGRVPVGICRSHRRRGLYLDQRDFEIFQTDFRHPSSIFLVVRRADADSARGAVFVWEEDDVRRHASYREFPLNARLVELQELSPGSTPGTPRKSANSSWQQWRLGDMPSFPKPSLPKLSTPGMVLRPATAAKVLVTLGLPLFSFFAARQIALHRVPEPQIEQIRPTADPIRLPVAVERDAPPEAGEKPKPFPAVLPEAPVRQVVSGPTATLKPTPAANARDRFDNPDSSSPAVSPPARTEDPPARVAPALPEPPAVQPARLAASFPRIMASPPAVSGRAPDQVVAYLKPVPPSSIRQAFQKVFTGHGADDGFVPANPIEHPLPSSPPDAVPLEDGVNIEMLAKVDRLGKVVNVKVVDGNRQLADRSTDALLRWRFDPARRNGSPIESAMRIRFEYRNPSK